MPGGMGVMEHLYFLPSLLEGGDTLGMVIEGLEQLGEVVGLNLSVVD